ncbi:hydrogen gas-evolving membrane-bound hydrogenase subunit E [Macrococcoides caseolyticum]|uniref:hydrogen gas-evolving membrane-bound hydrogenase subunit E n=1 Tax=Macrococcoides caseolyticum TaxID=69966 RepID=UPI001F4458E5|nr:hydrogen gas-evolving membrane-bound hydrogenase subunit E [Macrococcus caseolyticus]MCE4956527.1 DUF4040 domain-containing protein [Macrococcus caseolyticus]
MLNIIFVIGLVVVLLIQLFKKHLSNLGIGLLSLLFPLISVVVIMNTPKLETFTIPWIPHADLYFSLRLDAVSFFFFLLISVISIFVIFYSLFYMQKYNRHAYFYSSLTLFILAMYGVVLSNNTIILYLFWELTSVASFLLIAFHYNQKQSYAGAKKSFVITILGGSIMLVGLLLLNYIAGTSQIDELLKMDLHHHTLFSLSMLLIMVGALSKSAQFPFHIWLPDAMAAPTPVSALLHSATMVKAGIYLLIKLLPIYAGIESLSFVLLIVGIITMLMGSFVAISKHDMKALLAYSTISQLGMMVVFIGIIAFPGNESIVSYAYDGLFLLIIGHACYKATLFMGTGIVDLATGTRDMNKLSGLRKQLPLTYFTMVVSAGAMAGLPFLSGFLAKEYLITSLFELKSLHFIVYIIFIIAIIASIGTFIYSFVLIIRPFFGHANIQTQKLSPFIVVSNIVLTLITFTLFFIPNIIQSSWIQPIANEHRALHLKPITAWHGVTPPLIITILIFIIGSFVLIKGDYKYLYSAFNRIALNKAYENFGEMKDRIAKRSLSLIISESLNVYTIYLYLFIIALIMPNVLFEINPILTLQRDFTMFTMIIGIIMVVSALCLLFVKSRMTAVVLVGIVGYGISILFMKMKAPDLALTQLVIETITTVLFLACFYHLPNLKKEETSKGYKLIRHIIALSIAMIVFVIMVYGHQANSFATISTYYNNSYALAGAKNVVNAILGDFRAFDTMLEGVVIMIAGFGIYTILKKGAKHEGK